MKITRTRTAGGQYRPKEVAAGRSHVKHNGRHQRNFTLISDSPSGERYCVEISEREFLRMWGAVSGSELLQAFIPEQAGVAYHYLRHFVRHPRDPYDHKPFRVDLKEKSEGEE